MYSLVRLRDGRGDAGPQSWYVAEDGPILDARPTLGYALTVGSVNHWWTCTAVQEILEDTPDYVRFRTMNSIYVWKKLY